MMPLPNYDAWKLATPPDPCEGCPDYDDCEQDYDDCENKGEPDEEIL